ncbi:TonB-dependent receptor [Aurantivibrio infirmus]
MHQNIQIIIISITASIFISSIAHAQNPNVDIEEITISGSSQLSGAIVDEGLPYQVQSFNAKDIQSGQFNSIADLLDRQANGVSINHAQNNPLQPDVQVRGYSASPLLGAPQGVAVYLNGIRINEPFADTVNWDLIGGSSIQQISLLSGANAAYGLNALGGSLIATTKTGFDDDLSSVAANYGSFERRNLAASHGENNGRWGHYVALDNFDEKSWRDFSASKATNFYSSLNFRKDNLEWDFFAWLGDSNLRGNGAAPELLLKQDRDAVFTHPDITENNLLMFGSRNKFYLSDNSTINTSLFYRRNKTESFNGDGSEFEECAPPFDGFLCEDDEFVNDQFGNLVDGDFDAINNTSDRQQESWGSTIEYAKAINLGSVTHSNYFGVDFYQGETEFRSQVEFASLQADRSTSGSGFFDDEGETELQSLVRNYAVYWLDSFAVNSTLGFNFSIRYNHSQIITNDESGEAPELDGNHTYSGWNSGVGVTVNVSDRLQFYSSLHQSSRVPTPIELACSHPDAPCTLPNTFLADPPLDEVVARNFELGLRRKKSDAHSWQLNGFYSAISDDILFQSTGGVSSNEGFFSNASDTLRMGVSANYIFDGESFSWEFSYTWMRATFEDKFAVSSPNHPSEINGEVVVKSGDDIPGLPDHSFSSAVTWSMGTHWIFDADIHLQSGVHLRGDEANLDDKTDRSFTVNSQLRYIFNPKFSMSLTVNNVFDTEFESFGLYGEPDEVIPSLGEENTRFLSPNEPRGLWLGVRYRW